MQGILLLMVYSCQILLYIVLLFGSLVYLTITRPDIAYIIYVVSKFVVSPTFVHWVVVLHIL
jgi:hypothetical protein